MDFFHSTEFYVILFVVAASAVALAAKPAANGPVVERLLAGALRDAESRAEVPEIEVVCGLDGDVVIYRRGLPPVVAVSAAVEVKGFDITIRERLTASASDETVGGVEAVFVLDFLASERYHLRYESEATSAAATLTFRNTPGIDAVRPLLK